MAHYSNLSLGQTLRSRRNELGLSQAALAETAGYKSGGAVSLSRIESGNAHPSEARLEGLAGALGTTVAALIEEAVARDKAPHSGGTPTSGASAKMVRERAERLQGVLTERAATLETLGTRFASVQERAHDQFMAPLLNASSRVTGGLPFAALSDSETGAGDPKTAASSYLDAAKFGIAESLRSKAAEGLPGVGQAATAAFAAYAATDALGAAFGSAAWSAARLGIAGGVGALSGFALLPAAVAVIGAYAFMNRRTAAKLQALADELVVAEEQVANTDEAYLDLTKALGQGTRILEYIAVHGSHQLTRWCQALPDAPFEWDALSPGQRQQGQALVQVAGCFAAITAITYERFLTLEDGPEQFPPLEVRDEAQLSPREQFAEYCRDVLDTVERELHELV